jgi:hypothetical protein
MLPPILLTSCVYVSDKTVSLDNAAERITYTLESVKEWLNSIPTIQIVICDNSGYDFQGEIKRYFPDADVECLSFLGNKVAVSEYGKGYGEGEIIEYAISNSKHISNSKCFAKCTAKLWVKDPEIFLKNWNGQCAVKPVFKNIFSIRPAFISYIDTRFYAVSLDFYEKYFRGLHKKIKPSSPVGIEELFLEVLTSNNLVNIFWKKCPQIYGVSGASARPYQNSLKKEFKENFKYFLMQKKSQFKNLFYGF